MPRCLRHSLTVGCVTAALSFGHLAQASGQWDQDCAEGDRCVLSQTVFSPNDRTWLATVSLQKLSDDQTAVQVLVPAGVHLGSGLFWQINSRPYNSVPFQQCSAQYCRAAVVMEADDLAAWRAGRAVDMIYRPNSNVAPIRFAVSLMGISAGLDSLPIAEVRP